MITDAELDAIAARAHWTDGHGIDVYSAMSVFRNDVPALIAEVRRLRMNDVSETASRWRKHD